MKQDRRNILKGAGAMAAVAAAGGLTTTSFAETKPPRYPRGMAQKLTLLIMHRNGEYRLGAKTEQGIIDVPEAARLLKMHAPATMADLLQTEDGDGLHAQGDA